ncbi:MAG: hypothetical protein DHS20C19_19050 [Acidimicrobiales bacterium]|nr:MAG: hypothetical protein DHS20C19_19050 [Acidimicrobiales bacterium]
MQDPVVEITQTGRRPLRLVVTDALSVGRDCDGLLLDDRGISRTHLLLEACPGGVRVTDLESTNGTFLGDARITEPVVLGKGDEVRFGDCRAEVVAVPSPAPGPPLIGGRTQTAVAHVRPGTESTIDVVASSVLADPMEARREHRQGTITIVFSDIEDSTAQLTALGDERWYADLRAHNAIVEGAVARHRGSVVKHQGDGFMLTFPSAWMAVQAAFEVNERLQGVRATGEQPLRVRMGMHTGEVIVDDSGDLFGRHVNIAARIANEASAAEVLVSTVTRAVLEGRDDVAFGPGRSTDLKGLEGSFDVWPVLVGG